MEQMIDWPSSVTKAGDVYGRLTIVSTHKQGAKRYLAKCLCDCGNTVVVRIDALRKEGTKDRPATRSCGCLSKETATTHGRTKHPVFTAWSHMMRRCYSPKMANYKYYGGRGITVCERWHNIEHFIADMSHGYKKGLQLERKDNNEGYSPENCVWADRVQQMQNTRHNVYISFNGETKCLAEWSRVTGIPAGTLRHRHVTLKWTAEQVLTTPLYKIRSVAASLSATP